MLSKVKTVFKSTALLWVFSLIPLLICVRYMKNALECDSKECVDAFMVTEGIGLSKYISLQFENTVKEIHAIVAEVSTPNPKNANFLKKKLKSVLEYNKSISSIKVYDNDKKLLASSFDDNNIDLAEDKELDQLGDNISYTLRQLKNGTIILKYTIAKNFQQESDSSKKIFFEFTVKWNRYEKYMLKIQKGSFPRMFYIISPDFNRYISLNSLPRGIVSNRSVMVLGIHLSQKINEIPIGLSEKNIESINFRLFKDEILMPSKMKGSKFFIVIATDIMAVETISNKILGSISFIKTLLMIIWVLICLIITRFYIRTKEQLEITNVISDTTPLAIIIFKVSDGKIVRINLTASILLRIKKENVGAVNMWNLFIEEDDKSYITNAISSNINVSNYEVLVQSFEGGSFWSICSASPIIINNGKYVVLAILDINLRKEMEKKLANNAAFLEKQIIERTADLEAKAKELEESNTLLEKSKLVADEANKAKSKFLTNISNELKTPLSAIIGYSEILEEEAMDRKDTVTAEDLRKIIGSAKHLLSLIDEILDLSKIEAGKTQLFFENFEIVNLIKEVEGVAMPLIANNNNSLFLEYPRDLGIMYSDATKIRQCLLNLLSNAAKFTEFGKITLRVTPTTRSEGSFIEFSVIDTGVGIEESKVNAVFESFQENASNSSSSGLGLSLTKKYTEYLGGNIFVESTLGCGSTFSIRIPKVCKTISNEFIEVKNKKSDETLEDPESFTTNVDT
ncbi:MAG: PAS domain-containing sensor histidine kinase [Holosporaceae bacterium]|nr:PAS domain-containing sensor histidine kinase [Holosporaceae bacterium]